MDTGQEIKPNTRDRIKITPNMNSDRSQQERIEIYMSLDKRIKAEMQNLPNRILHRTEIIQYFYCENIDICKPYAFS